MSEDYAIIPVQVQNWPATQKSREPLFFTARTYVLDAGGELAIQVADEEPTRVRMVIIAIDAAIMVVNGRPAVRPDTSAAATPPAQGGYLPTGLPGLVLYGQNEVWINQTGASTRVTVLKEYC